MGHSAPLCPPDLSNAVPTVWRRVTGIRGEMVLLTHCVFSRFIPGLHTQFTSVFPLLLRFMFCSKVLSQKLLALAPECPCQLRWSLSPFSCFTVEVEGDVSRLQRRLHVQRCRTPRRVLRCGQHPPVSWRDPCRPCCRFPLLTSQLLWCERGADAFVGRSQPLTAEEHIHDNTPPSVQSARLNGCTC